MNQSSSDKAILYQELWNSWLSQLNASPQRVLLLPGILGSELFDHTHKRWVHFHLGLDMLGISKLGLEGWTPQGQTIDDSGTIIAKSPLSWPLAPYSKILSDPRIQPACFPFDWRADIAFTAAQLGGFLEEAIEAGIIDQGDNKLHLLTHSMGGVVLLTLLAQTRAFDPYIKNIIFAVPPFHGAHGPLRPIELGEFGMVDWMIPNKTLMKASASMPGLFELLIAPDALWPSSFDLQEEPIPMRYPVLGSNSLLSPGTLYNTYHPELREPILSLANDLYLTRHKHLESISERLGSRISIIVGLGSQTPTFAYHQDHGAWTIKRYKGQPDVSGALPGDGTVLTPSSLLPGLAPERYWAAQTNMGPEYDIHTKVYELNSVLDAVASILSEQTPNTLQPLRNVEIDFGPLHLEFEHPLEEHLEEYHAQHESYASGFAATHAVLQGASIQEAAEQHGLASHWLEDHVRKRIFF